MPLGKTGRCEQDGVKRQTANMLDAFDDGRFCFVIPLTGIRSIGCTHYLRVEEGGGVGAEKANVTCDCPFRSLAFGANTEMGHEDFRAKMTEKYACTSNRPIWASFAEC